MFWIFVIATFFLVVIAVGSFMGLPFLFASEETPRAKIIAVIVLFMVSLVAAGVMLWMAYNNDQGWSSTAWLLLPIVPAVILLVMAKND